MATAQLNARMVGVSSLAWHMLWMPYLMGASPVQEHMAIPLPKRSPQFLTLPRHRRSVKVRQLKQKILRDAPDYGGRFTSDLVLNEPGRPRIYDQWFDFIFPGADKFTLWNASIRTAQKAFWDEVTAFAYESSTALMSPQERAENEKVELVPALYSSTGKVLAYEEVEREEIRFAQFGGRTFSKQLRKLESEIAKDAPPVIHETFKTDRRYAYGIGLQIVLDVDFINQAAIESAMDRFIGIGETDWLSPNPVPRERLPQISESDALDEYRKKIAPEKVRET